MLGKAGQTVLGKSGHEESSDWCDGHGRIDELW